MNEIGRKITDKLIEINGSADCTIAFLPYKRSMWDCMESVYEECLKSNIEAHCMPIPYLRLKENRQIDYIDTDYEYFENAEPIEALHDPRFIVIHYQYDGNNKVTGMLPEFYTDALKERYRADIVFIPYGIPYGGLSIRHHRIQPGLINVDWYFLHSEEERLGFIEDWKSVGVDLTDRVFGFGNPKIDAMHKLKKEMKGDVTLVATSLSAMIRDPYERINIYRQIVARENEKGRVVIFRPHPLLETTIKSMCPEIQPHYERLLTKLSNICIIDKSEYLGKALGNADRLICDPSSLVELWKETGKPYEVIE